MNCFTKCMTYAIKFYSLKNIHKIACSCKAKETKKCKLKLKFKTELRNIINWFRIGKKIIASDNIIRRLSGYEERREFFLSNERC